MRDRLLLVATLVLAGACAPGFAPFREVAKSRVIGATITVDSDPTKFSPAPGETATMTLVVADPGPKQGRTWALVVCRPGSSQLDAVYCDEPSRFVGASYSPTLPAVGPFPDPSVSFTVPDLATLGDATELWVMGAVCNGGTVRDLLTDPPVYGEPWEPCMEDPLADPQPVGQLITTRIKLHVDDNSANHAPDLLSLTLDGAAWTSVAPDDAPTEGCSGSGTYPEITADGLGHTVIATSSPSSREVYVPEGLETSYPEDLFLFLFRTAGDASPGYGVIDDTSSVAMLDYLPPPATEVAQNGTLVRFWVQLADDRDASTFVQRAVCVVRP